MLLADGMLLADAMAQANNAQINGDYGSCMLP
jgi:hypothetical protein